VIIKMFKRTAVKPVSEAKVSKVKSQSKAAIDMALKFDDLMEKSDSQVRAENAPKRVYETKYGEATNEINPLDGQSYGDIRIEDGNQVLVLPFGYARKDFVPYDPSVLDAECKRQDNAEIQATSIINPITRQPYPVSVWDNSDYRSGNSVFSSNELQKYHFALANTAADKNLVARVFSHPGLADTLTEAKEGEQGIYGQSFIESEIFLKVGDKTGEFTRPIHREESWEKDPFYLSKKDSFYPSNLEEFVWKMYLTDPRSNNENNISPISKPYSTTSKILNSLDLKIRPYLPIDEKIKIRH
jgi:hypothetical protein